MRNNRVLSPSDVNTTLFKVFSEYFMPFNIVLYICSSKIDGMVIASETFRNIITFLCNQKIPDTGEVQLDADESLSLFMYINNNL